MFSLEQFHNSTIQVLPVINSILTSISGQEVCRDLSYGITVTAYVLTLHVLYLWNYYYTTILCPIPFNLYSNDIVNTLLYSYFGPPSLQLV